MFPGGVSDPADAPLTASLGYETAGSQGQMLVNKVTALREAFEEAGVLLTRSKNPNETHPVKVEFAKKLFWQAEVHKDGKNFSNLLKEFNVDLPVNDIFYWITFITPVMEPKRFRANFFVAIIDDSAGVQLDGGETIEYRWIKPSEAIKLNKEGKMPFLPPQYFVLSTISKYATLESIVSEAKRMTSDPPVEILPHPVDMDENRLTLSYPGDEEHCDFPIAGSRNRIHCSKPLGSGGYEMETTLSNGPFCETSKVKSILDKSKL